MAPSLLCVCYRNLDQNSIQTIDPASFKGLPVLRSLRLDSNKLEVVPTQALAPLKTLEILWVYILMSPCAPCKITSLKLALTSRDIRVVFVYPSSFRSSWPSSSLRPETERLNWKCNRLRWLLQSPNPKADNFYENKNTANGTVNVLNNLDESCYVRLLSQQRVMQIWIHNIFLAPSFLQTVLLSMTSRFGDRIPVGTRFSARVQTGPQALPASCTMGTRCSYRGYSSQGMAFITHSHLAPRLKKE
jgi:hypothetical protein